MQLNVTGIKLKARILSILSNDGGTIFVSWLVTYGIVRN